MFLLVRLSHTTNYVLHASALCGSILARWLKPESPTVMVGVACDKE